MAMNKKEQAERLELIEQAGLNRALHWSNEPVPRDLPPPQSGDGYTNGWSINVYTATVYPSWSNSVFHGERGADQIVTRRDAHMSASQRPISQYSTREIALRALRCELERQAAEKLYRVDLMIADERGKDDDPL